jgi:hypothetical protein
MNVTREPTSITWTFEPNLISKFLICILIIILNKNLTLALDVICLLPESASFTLPRIASMLVDYRFVNY